MFSTIGAFTGSFFQSDMSRLKEFEHLLPSPNKSLISGQKLQSVYSRSQVKLTNRSPDFVRQEILICSYCSATFTSNTGLRNHIRRHTGQFRHNCDICNKGFMFKTDYEGHMNVHMNLKPYGCDWCDKSFAYKQSFMNHRKHCKTPLA